MLRSGVQYSPSNTDYSPVANSWFRDEAAPLSAPKNSDGSGTGAYPSSLDSAAGLVGYGSAGGAQTNGGILSSSQGSALGGMACPVAAPPGGHDGSRPQSWFAGLRSSSGFVRVGNKGVGGAMRAARWSGTSSSGVSGSRSNVNNSNNNNNNKNKDVNRANNSNSNGDGNGSSNSSGRKNDGDLSIWKWLVKKSFGWATPTSEASALINKPGPRARRGLPGIHHGEVVYALRGCPGEPDVGREGQGGYGADGDGIPSGAALGVEEGWGGGDTTSQ